MDAEYMNESHDIFILQLCERLPAQLRETLIQKGFPTYVTSDFKAIAESLKGLPRPIVLVLSREGTEASFADTKQLISLGALHEYPLILVGTDVDSYENILNQHFALATTLSAPCSNAEILQAVTYVVRSYPSRAPTKPQADLEDSPQLPPVLEPLPTEPTPEIPVIEHSAYKKQKGIPDVFFAALEGLGAITGGLGGDIYPRGMEEEFIREQNLFPQAKELQEAARTICLDVGRWGRLHLYRSVYFCNCLLKVLKVTDEQREHAKAALFLFSLSYAGDTPDLLRREYYDARHSAFRRDLCSRIKDSAMTVALELKAPEIGNLMATFGRLVGREEAVNDSPISLVASAMMAADIADRVCFQSGHWNPRRTYSFMKRVKSGQLIDLHPAVLCCTVKFLNEAIEANPHTMILTKHLRNDPRLQKAAQAWKEQTVAQDEKKVALVNLMPGMRLSRPVVTYDGREILSSDVKLDQDLIWRLWQLSTVRPLNGPVVIFSKN